MNTSSGIPALSSDIRLLISDFPCLLVVDPPGPGDWNMAVDEAILGAASACGLATLRLYQWSEPTLSLGYFQRYDDRQQHAASLDCAVVRRSSGGGAILHDRELTYSLTLPPDHPLARKPQQLYSIVHQAFVELLNRSLAQPASCGALAKYRDIRQSPVRNESEPFLCFARRSPDDIVLSSNPSIESSSAPPATWKIIGSAQRRRGGAVLQHGSALLNRSQAAPELPGFNDLVGGTVSANSLCENLPRQLGPRLGLAIQPATVPVGIIESAQTIQREKYASRSWTARR